MIYAAPDTRHAGYVNAVYYSDSSPLDNFICQQRNPLTYHRDGLITGAGHGCVEKGPNDTLWAFYTIATPVDHEYERRIGMDMIAVDENGELYCPFGVTDTPQYAPGYIKAPLADGNSPCLYNLTGGTRPTASSSAEGRNPIYATDESNLSWWQPHDSDEAPWIECDLDGRFSASAVRLFWRDVRLDYAKGILPAPIGFILEGELDGKWITLLDRSHPELERNIDYETFEDTVCERVRLRITSWNKELGIGVVDFAVFGICADDIT